MIFRTICYGNANLTHPPRLKAGDTIGIAAPAGPFETDLFDQGMDVLRDMGFKVHVPEAVFQREGFLAGPDTTRAKVINTLFADRGIQGIICARGGYGSTRVLPHLDWDVVRRHPKIFVGFSDITVLHCALLDQAGLVTFHGPMGTTLAKMDATSLGVFSQVLMGDRPLILSPSEAVTLCPGEATGMVVGGNLTMLCHLVGTSYQPAFKGRILFLEDVTEAPYRIDRMLVQMALAGCFENLAGLVLGQFENCGDAEAIHAVFRQVFDPMGIPVAAGFPIGHGAENATLPMGIEARLSTHPPQLAYLDVATT